MERPWEPIYPPGVPSSYDYPIVDLPRILDDAARDFPSVTAIQYLGSRISYRRLLEQVDRFAAALAGLGVGRGDRVAVVLPTCPQHVVAIFAVLRLGGIVSAHDPALELEALIRQVCDAGANTVVLLDRLAADLEPHRDDLPDVHHWILTHPLAALSSPRRVLAHLRHPRRVRRRTPNTDAWLVLENLMAAAPPSSAQERIDPSEDAALLVYPEARAQPPRGIVFTHHSLLASAFQIRLWMPDVQAGDESCLAVEPFHHPFGFTATLMVGILSAATLNLVPWPDPVAVLDAIEHAKPTLLALTAARFRDLAAVPETRRDLTSVRLALSCGKPLSDDVVRRFEDRSGAKLAGVYGPARGAGLTHANPLYGRAKRGGIGLPLPDTVAIALDPADLSKPSPTGEAGVLAIAGPQVMRGYWRRAEDTARDLQDGWLITGERARMDDEGYFRLEG